MKFLLTLLLFVPLLSFGQIKLKKKYCGSFSGTIPAYTMEIGTEVVGIDSTSIKIELNVDGNVKYTIGNIIYTGKYSVNFISDAFIFVSANLSNQKSEEHLKIFLKDKHIEREGIFPQPTAYLKKED